MLNDFWVFVSCALLFIGLAASQGLLLVVGGLVLAVWVLARFWNRFAFREVSHERTLSRTRAFVGDSLDYSVTLSNDKVLPLIWVDIQDHLPPELDLPGATVRGTGLEVGREHRITTSLLPYQRVTWKYLLRCRARGYHRIGPARLRSGDIFGFTAFEAPLTGAAHILVYPRIVNLRELMLPSEHPLGETRGLNPVHQDTSRFFGLRDYQPQDPMKHIDWKATARRGGLQTRLFEPAVSLNALIAMNAATGQFAWQGSNRRLFERTVTVAASVASHCAGEGYSFGLVSNGVAAYSGKWLSVPLSSSPSQLGVVLESLAMAAPYSVISLGEALRQERDSLPPGTTIILVTAIITAAINDEIAAARSRGYRLIVLYAGDRGPEMRPGDVPVFFLGRALEALEVEQEGYESVLAN